jgi:hypothetical protein
VGGLEVAPDHVDQVGRLPALDPPLGHGPHQVVGHHRRHLVGAARALAVDGQLGNGLAAVATSCQRVDRGGDELVQVLVHPSTLLVG